MGRVKDENDRIFFDITSAQWYEEAFEAARAYAEDRDINNFSLIAIGLESGIFNVPWLTGVSIDYSILSPR